MAELDARLPVGFDSGQTLSYQVRRAQRDVLLEFLVHLGVQDGARMDPVQEGAQASREAGEHQVSCGRAASDVAIASARRFQLAVSATSRLRPAAVSL